MTHGRGGKACSFSGWAAVQACCRGRVTCVGHEWWSCSTHGRGGEAGSFSGWAAVLLLHLLALLLATVVTVVVNVSVVCESLLSSLLLFSSLRNLFACLSQFRYCPPASFETSSHVFRSFAFVPPQAARFPYCPLEGRSVCVLSPRRLLGLLIVPPKAA